jgi:DNA (cytosine-5)-methyltransferase 1
MKILNLFAGIGGNRTLWGDKHEITAVEHDQRIAMIYHKRFPKDQVIIGDAYNYLEEFYQEYDFIWASPPCTTHSILMFPQKKKKLPDLRLYSLILFLKHHFHGKWVVENVKGYYKPLVRPSATIDRHYIWANFPLRNRNDFMTRKRFDYLGIKDFCKMHHINDDFINNLNMDSSKKRQILRNCVLPEAGKYILDQISKDQSILNYV